MIRKDSPDFIMIQAHNAPYGATINTMHITNVRLQPEINEQNEATGRVQVLVCLVDGAHSLTYDSLEEAQPVYFQLSNELRGTPSDG